MVDIDGRAERDKGKSLCLARRDWWMILWTEFQDPKTISLSPWIETNNTIPACRRLVTTSFARQELNEIPLAEWRLHKAGLIVRHVSRKVRLSDTGVPPALFRLPDVQQAVRPLKRKK